MSVRCFNQRLLRRRSGLTMVELLVVISIVALMTALSAPATRPRGENLHAPDDLVRAEISGARKEAIRSGRRVTVRLPVNTPVFVTALPDGRLLGVAALGWNELSGKKIKEGPAR